MVIIRVSLAEARTVFCVRTYVCAETERSIFPNNRKAHNCNVACVSIMPAMPSVGIRVQGWRKEWVLNRGVRTIPKSPTLVLHIQYKHGVWMPCKAKHNTKPNVIERLLETLGPTLLLGKACKTTEN